jgi:hypothetical protein
MTLGEVDYPEFLMKLYRLWPKNEEGSGMCLLKMRDTAQYLNSAFVVVA